METAKQISIELIGSTKQFNTALKAAEEAEKKLGKQRENINKDVSQTIIQTVNNVKEKQVSALQAVLQKEEENLRKRLATVKKGSEEEYKIQKEFLEKIEQERKSISAKTPKEKTIKIPGITGLIDSMSPLQKMIGGVTAGITAFGVAAYKAAQAAAEFEKPLNHLGNSLGYTSEQTKQLGDTLLYIEKPAGVASSKVAEVAKIVGGFAKDEIPVVTEKILKLGDAFGKTENLDELANGVRQVSLVTGDAGKSVDLISNLAKSMDGDVTGAIEALTSILPGAKAAFRDVGQATKQSTALFEAFRGTGLSVQDSVQKTEDFIFKLNKRLSTTEGIEGLKDALSSTGLKLKDVGLESGKLDLSKLINTMSKGGETATALQLAFSKSGATFDATSESLDILTTSLQSSGKTFQDYNLSTTSTVESIESLEPTFDSLSDRISGSFDTLVVKVGQGLSPLTEGVMSIIAGTLEGVASLFQNTNVIFEQNKTALNDLTAKYVLTGETINTLTDAINAPSETGNENAFTLIESQLTDIQSVSPLAAMEIQNILNAPEGATTDNLKRINELLIQTNDMAKQLALVEGFKAVENGAEAVAENISDILNLPVDSLAGQGLDIISSKINDVKEQMKTVQADIAAGVDVQDNADTLKDLTQQLTQFSSAQASIQTELMTKTQDFLKVAMQTNDINNLGLTSDQLRAQAISQLTAEMGDLGDKTQSVIEKSIDGQLLQNEIAAKRTQIETETKKLIEDETLAQTALSGETLTTNQIKVKALEIVKANLVAKKQELESMLAEAQIAAEGLKIGNERNKSLFKAQQLQAQLNKLLGIENQATSQYTETNVDSIINNIKGEISKVTSQIASVDKQIVGLTKTEKVTSQNKKDTSGGTGKKAKPVEEKRLDTEEKFNEQLDKVAEKRLIEEKKIIDSINDFAKKLREDTSKFNLGAMKDIITSFVKNLGQIDNINTNINKAFNDIIGVSKDAGNKISELVGNISKAQGEVQLFIGKNINTLATGLNKDFHVSPDTTPQDAITQLFKYTSGLSDSIQAAVTESMKDVSKDLLGRLSDQEKAGLMEFLSQIELLAKGTESITKRITENDRLLDNAKKALERLKTEPDTRNVRSQKESTQANIAFYTSEKQRLAGAQKSLTDQIKTFQDSREKIISDYVNLNALLNKPVSQQIDITVFRALTEAYQEIEKRQKAISALQIEYNDTLDTDTQTAITLQVQGLNEEIDAIKSINLLNNDIYKQLLTLSNVDKERLDNLHQQNIDFAIQQNSIINLGTTLNSIIDQLEAEKQLTADQLFIIKNINTWATSLNDVVRERQELQVNELTLARIANAERFRGLQLEKDGVITVKAGNEAVFETTKLTQNQLYVLRAINDEKANSILLNTKEESILRERVALADKQLALIKAELTERLANINRTEEQNKTINELQNRQNQINQQRKTDEQAIYQIQVTNNKASIDLINDYIIKVKDAFDKATDNQSAFWESLKENKGEAVKSSAGLDTLGDFFTSTKKAFESIKLKVDMGDTEGALDTLGSTMEGLGQQASNVFDAITAIPEAFDAVSQLFENQDVGGGVQKIGDLTTQIGIGLLGSGITPLMTAGAVILGIGLITKLVGKIISLFQKQGKSELDIQKEKSMLYDRLNSQYQTAISLNEKLAQLGSRQLDQAREQLAAQKELNSLRETGNEVSAAFAGLTDEQIVEKVKTYTDQKNIIDDEITLAEAAKEGNRETRKEYLAAHGLSTKGNTKKTLRAYIESLKVDQMNLNNLIEEGNSLLDNGIKERELERQVLEETIGLMDLRIRLGADELTSTQTKASETADYLKGLLLDTFDTIPASISDILDNINTTSLDDLKTALLALTGDPDTSELSSEMMSVINELLDVKEKAEDVKTALDDLFERRKTLLGLEKELNIITNADFVTEMMTLLNERLALLQGELDAMDEINSTEAERLDKTIEIRQIQVEIKNLMDEQNNTLRESDHLLGSLIRRHQAQLRLTRADGRMTADEQTALNQTRQAMADRLRETGATEEEITAFLQSLPAFEKGGIVPGEKGKPVPVLAHAGEMIVPVKDVIKSDKLEQRTLESVDNPIFIGLNKMIDFLVAEKPSQNINQSSYMFNINQTFDVKNMTPEKARETFQTGLKDVILDTVNRAIKEGKINPQR